MIERFNFYDLYGYLIPGLLLLVLVWLPFGVVGHWVPEAKWLSLASAALIAYVLGNLLHSISSKALPSKTMRDAAGRAAFPSVVLLDRSCRMLNVHVKERLAQLVRTAYGIDLQIDADADEAIAGERQAAYSLCRDAADPKTSSANQFQGLYAMCRGLCVAFGLGACFDAGWTAVLLWQGSARAVTISVEAVLVGVLGTLVGAIAATTKDDDVTERYALVMLAILFLAGGFWLAAWHGAGDVRGPGVLIVATLLSVAACLRFYKLYENHAESHARAVWTQYLNLHARPKGRREDAS